MTAPHGEGPPAGEALADRAGRGKQSTAQGTPASRRDVRPPELASRWPSPDVAADELIEALGTFWCSALMIELGKAIRGVR